MVLHYTRYILHCLQQWAFVDRPNRLNKPSARRLTSDGSDFVIRVDEFLISVAENRALII